MAGGSDMPWVISRNPNMLTSRNHLAAVVWGELLSYESRVIDNHIGRLRRKLQLDRVSGIRLNTQYGMGYILEADIEGIGEPDVLALIPPVKRWLYKRVMAKRGDRTPL
jgi:DNA-binding winged helix-turn-helix (wHTH) protein